MRNESFLSTLMAFKLTNDNVKIQTFPLINVALASPSPTLTTTYLRAMLNVYWMPLWSWVEVGWVLLYWSQSFIKTFISQFLLQQVVYAS